MGAHNVIGRNHGGRWKRYHRRTRRNENFDSEAVIYSRIERNKYAWLSMWCLDNQVSMARVLAHLITRFQAEQDPDSLPLSDTHEQVFAKLDFPS